MEEKGCNEGVEKLVNAIAGIYRQAEQVFAPMVADLIRDKCRDPQQIEPFLGSMLGYANYDPILLLFKKLCRHYYFIDPEAAAWYVYKYKEMWDYIDSEEEEEKIG